MRLQNLSMLSLARMAGVSTTGAIEQRDWRRLLCKFLPGSRPTRSFLADPRRCAPYATGLKESPKRLFQFLSKERAGKEILAKLIHIRSPWRERRFVKVLCPAVPASVFENALLDFEAKLLGGTTNANPGHTEAAQGGTLFVDEIADLDTQLQAKLLRLLQEGRVLRIGASEVPQATSGGMRVLCATHR